MLGDLQTNVLSNVFCAPLQGLSAPAFYFPCGLIQPCLWLQFLHPGSIHLGRPCPFVHSTLLRALQASELSAALFIPLQRPSFPLCGSCRRCCPRLRVLTLALYAGTPLFWPHFGPSLPFRGVRVGEAKNPGPQQDIRSFFQSQEQFPANIEDSTPSCSSLPDAGGLVTLAVVNPTSIHNKEHLVAALSQDVVFLSETSAVLKVQQSSTAKFGRLKYTCSWGPPFLHTFL